MKSFLQSYNIWFNVNFNEISKNYRDINTNNTAKLFSVMPEDKLIILEYLKNYKTTNLKQLRDKKNITKILNFKKDYTYAYGDDWIIE